MGSNSGIKKPPVIRRYISIARAKQAKSTDYYKRLAFSDRYFATPSGDAPIPS